MADKQTVAVLGAGSTMGFAMARNIARGGHDVRAWNRSRDKAEPLTEDGAQVFDTPGEAARGANVILTMLADADAVIASMDGDDGALTAPHADEAIWLQMSTIGEEATDWCAGLAGRYGAGFVDAPVLGTREPAEKGELVVLASGPEEARPRVQPVFDAIGLRTIHVGQAGAGTRLKLVANSWVLAVVQTGAETVALAEGPRRRSGAVLPGHRGWPARPALPADQGPGDGRPRLHARLPPRARRQGRGPGGRRGLAAWPGAAPVRRDRAPAQPGERGTRRRGRQRHVPDQRP